MRIFRSFCLSFFVLALLAIATVRPCHAHFTWILRNDAGHAILFFSESPKERDYKSPEFLANAKVTATVSGKPAQQIDHSNLEQDDFAGRISKAPVPGNATLETSCIYGVYHGTLLKYYVKHIPGASLEAAGESKQNVEMNVTLDGVPLSKGTVTLVDAEGKSISGNLNASGEVVFPREVAMQRLGHPVKISVEANSNPKPISKEAKPEGLKLDATAKKTEHGIDLYVTWEGKPLEGAAVTLLDPSGEQAIVKSDKQGFASFASIQKGLVGFLVNHTVDPAEGEHNGEKYTSETNYLSVTVDYDPSQKAHAAKEPSGMHPHAKANAPTVKTDFPPLSIGIASFGAAVDGDWLYVYGGHTGTPHDHSQENLANQFCRVSISNTQDRQWESLPIQTKLQGLPLVAAKGKIYRIGGLDARNTKEEDEDLHSVDEFASFDPTSKTWTSLPALPEPRSSHDAVVVDNKIYVMGGWNLKGKGTKPEWLSTAWVYDLNSEKGEWKSLATPPFSRRALALSQWNDKIVVVCGMDENAKVSMRIDCFDPKTNTWSRLPDYPGSDNHGFGISAWNLDGKLYANGNEGIVYRLSDDAKSWKEVAKVQQPRFFHRLLPGGPNELLIVAGTSFTAGHLKNVERVKVVE